MNSLKKILKEISKKKKDDPCWDGYQQLGTKTKNGKEVPNCVPEEENEDKKKSKKVVNEAWDYFQTDLNKNLVENNPFRLGSENYFELINLVREKYNDGEIELNSYNKFFIESDLGEFDKFDDQWVPLDCPMVLEEDEEKELNEPKRGGPKKFYVYVKNKLGNIIKVTFGDPNLSVKFDDEGARKSFNARHKCSTKKDKTKAGWWSCNLPRYAKQLGLSGGGDFFW